jgi:Protein of unknown function (DUF1236)
MKKYQNTLLAGVAALALVAGTGLASAQQSSEHMGGSKAASPQAGQSMNRGSMQSQAQEKGKGTQTQAQEKAKGTETQAQEKGKATQTQAQEKAKGTETQAQEKGKVNANQTARTGAETGNNMGKRGTSSNARAERMNRGSKGSQQNTAEQQRTLKGLQGNTTKPMQGENQQGSNPQGNNGAQASGGAQVQGSNVRLSEQQRTQIRDTVINGHNAPRVGHVDFDVRVGTVIPRGRIHIVPVPETLVRIEPRWRGFLYFVYEDEVVIVNPRTYLIVAVVPA